MLINNPLPAKELWTYTTRASAHGELARLCSGLRRRNLWCPDLSRCGSGCELCCKRRYSLGRRGLTRWNLPRSTTPTPALLDGTVEVAVSTAIPD